MYVSNCTLSDVHVRGKHAHVRIDVLPVQFDTTHEHGSSVGKSRITRRAYSESYYVEMMEEAFRMWSDLEKETGTTLYKYVHVPVHVQVYTICCM